MGSISEPLGLRHGDPGPSKGAGASVIRGVGVYTARGDGARDDRRLERLMAPLGTKHPGGPSGRAQGRPLDHRAASLSEREEPSWPALVRRLESDGPQVPPSTRSGHRGPVARTGSGYVCSTRPWQQLRRRSLGAWRHKVGHPPSSWSRVVWSRPAARRSRRLRCTHPWASAGSSATALVMFSLAAGKARIDAELRHPVLSAEARVTVVDGALATGVLAELICNALFGWWWADLVSGAIVIAYGVREGIHHLVEGST
jgi:hypothetical protein